MNAAIHFAPSASKHAGIASCALFQPLAGTGLGFPAWQVHPFVPSRITFPLLPMIVALSPKKDGAAVE